MRAVCFIRKFQLLLDCNNYENQTSKSRTSQTRKTLAVMLTERNRQYLINNYIFVDNITIKTWH
jgi:hypothetical protein